MMKSLIAGITAVSMTLASTTSLHAQGMERDDVGKLLIGLATIAVIGAAIDQNRDRKTEPSTPIHDSPGWSGINSNSGWSDLNRRHDDNRQARRIVPHACLQTVETRFGHQRLFGRRCLERNYRHVNRLPDRCAVRLYTTQGPRRGYDPLCLREQGYRSDRRH